MIQKLKKNIFIVIVFSAIFYLAYIIYSDFPLLVNTIKNYSPLNFFITLIIITVSLILKYFRWHFYLKKLKVDISIKDSINIFGSGLLMSISPGKLGEFLKVFLISQKYDYPKSRVSAIIFAERIIEFVTLLILTLVAILFLNYSNTSIIFATSVTLIIVLFFSLKQVRGFVLKALLKISVIKENIKSLENFTLSIEKLFKIKTLIVTFTISAIAWLFEIYGFYYVIQSLTDQISFVQISLDYLISIVVGAISMIPGGIGTTEGTLTYLLSKSGIEISIATVATLLIRIVTLWFSVLLGVIFLLLFSRNRQR